MERTFSLEARPVRDRSPEDSQEPYQAAKEPGQIRGALRREGEDFVKVAGQRGKHCVVGETLEELGNIGDPEGALEAGSYLVETLAEAHFSPGWKRSDCTGARWRSKGVGGL